MAPQKCAVTQVGLFALTINSVRGQLQKYFVLKISVMEIKSGWSVGLPVMTPVSRHHSNPAHCSASKSVSVLSTQSGSTRINRMKRRSVVLETTVHVSNAELNL